MNRRRAKVVVRLAFAAIIGLVGIATFVLMGRAMASITRDENTSDVFNEAATLPSDLRSSIEWLADADDLPRTMEPLTRQLITDAWLRGWAQYAIVAEGGEATGLNEYFSNSAKQALLDAQPGWLAHPMHQIGHDLQLQFYSEDGSVAALTSTSSRFLRRIPTTEGEPIWFDADESFDVVLLLEDGNWRIQHLVRRAAEGVWWSQPPPRATEPPPDNILALDYLPRGIVANELFASATDLGQLNIDSDLLRMRELGVNTIRVPLHFDTVGGRMTNRESLAPVVELLDTAAAVDMGVIVSLFAGRTDHRVLHWDADDDHLRTVVETLGDHPALVLWELQHNVDLTAEVEGVDRSIVDAWSGHVARSLRIHDADTPMTMTWSTARAAIEAAPFVDVVGFESPADLTVLPDVIADLHDRHAGAPILLHGRGVHTWNSIWPGGSTEKEQAATTALLLQAIRQLDLAGSVVAPFWDLKDPPNDSNRWPWATGPTLHAGLVTTQGDDKPAADLIGANHDNLDDFLAVATPTLADGMRKPFNLAALVCLAALMLLGLFRWRSRGFIQGSALPINSAEEIDLQSQKKHLKDSAAAAIGSETVTPKMPTSKDSPSDKTPGNRAGSNVPPPPPGIVPGKPVVSRPAPTPDALKSRPKPADDAPATESPRRLEPPVLKPPLLKPPVLEAPPLPPVNSGIAPAGMAPAGKVSADPVSVPKPTSTNPPQSAAPTRTSLQSPSIVPPLVPPPISGIAPPPAPSPQKLVPSPAARTGAPVPAPAKPARPQAETAAGSVELPAGVPKPKFVAPQARADVSTVDQLKKPPKGNDGKPATAKPAAVPTAKQAPPTAKTPVTPTPPTTAPKPPATKPPTAKTPVTPKPPTTAPKPPAATPPTAKTPVTPKPPTTAPKPPAATPPTAKTPVTPTPPTTAPKAPATTPPPSAESTPAEPAKSEPIASPGPKQPVAPTTTPTAAPTADTASPMRPPLMKPPKMVRPTEPAPGPAVTASPIVSGPAPMAAVIPPATPVAPPATPVTPPSSSPSGESVNLVAVGQIMQTHGGSFLQRSGAALTAMPFVERAVCDALLNFPAINGNHQKIHLAVQPSAVEYPGVITDADYKTLRILALETAFPGQPEVPPTFTIIEGRPSRAAADTMPTTFGLMFEVGGGNANLSLVSKTPNLVSPAESDSFLQRIKSTLETHDWHSEIA